jgi:hypothetical protein
MESVLAKSEKLTWQRRSTLARRGSELQEEVTPAQAKVK